MTRFRLFPNKKMHIEMKRNMIRADAVFLRGMGFERHAADTVLIVFYGVFLTCGHAGEG